MVEMHVWASACVAKATSVRPAADDDFVLHNSVLKMTMQYVKFFLRKVAFRNVLVNDIYENNWNISSTIFHTA